MSAVTLIAPGVERGACYAVACNGYWVFGVTYANAFERVVRFRCEDGSETELRGQVEVIPMDEQSLLNIYGDSHYGYVV